MGTLASWKKKGNRPNYNTNVDLRYPYSELPYLGQYHLVKLPIKGSTTIDHVDYWGEGRIVVPGGASGFPNSYNINHQFQEVSNGGDRDKKIPNRIPVPDYDNCDTSAYIMDNSVRVVTLMGAPINKSCARDIARMIKNDIGSIILYGFQSNSGPFNNVKEMVTYKRLFYCPHYDLPDDLQGLTLFDSYVAFLNFNDMKELIYHNIIKGEYDKAVEQTKQFDDEAMKDFATGLLTDKFANVIMSFIYKLWESNGKTIIRNYFPKGFELIYEYIAVKFINQEYDMVLTLDSKVDSPNKRLAIGDRITTSLLGRLDIRKVWENNSVTFELNQTKYGMCINLGVKPDSYGDRQAWGSNCSNERRFRFYLEPLYNNEEVEFFIINCEYGQGLKLDVTPSGSGARRVWGSKVDVHVAEILEKSKRFRWVVREW